ncbi:MAG: esterase, partial [Methyloglobulus sp.]|nr:esterase [Methyloglobulus sp.]
MSKHVSFMVLLWLVLSGCAQDEIYRSDISECLVTPSNQCGTSSFQVYNDAGFKYSLATVEIDDQGQLQKRDQLDLMLNKLKSEEAALIVVFVHGWHHNAQGATPEEYEDLNIQNFRNQLAAISGQEKKSASPRKIFGVYVGWRGDSIEVDGLNVATFWERKNTAEEVGHLGLTEILLRLEEIRDNKNTDASKPKSRLVVVGHSFGGAAVFSATAQIFADRYIKKHYGEGHHKDLDNSHEGFGDLVVLINPAFEALRYAPLYDMAQSDCIDNPDQKPKLTILTSEG